MKPVVFYTKAPFGFLLGERALLKGVENHPKGLLGLYVSTSEVIKIEEDGTSFETLNTLYRKKQQ